MWTQPLPVCVCVPCCFYWMLSSRSVSERSLCQPLKAEFPLFVLLLVERFQAPLASVPSPGPFPSGFFPHSKVRGTACSKESLGRAGGEKGNGLQRGFCLGKPPLPASRRLVVPAGFIHTQEGGVCPAPPRLTP